MIPTRVPVRHCKMRHNLMLGQKRQTYTVDRGTNHELNVIDNQRSINGDRQGLLALLELPPVQTGRAVPKVDAPML